MKTPNLRLPFAFAAAFVGFSAAANAGEVSFRFHADDLTDPAGLYEEMAEAAAAACETRGRKGLWSIRADEACAAALLDDFVAGAASPALTAVHQVTTDARVAALR